MKKLTLENAIKKLGLKIQEEIQTIYVDANSKKKKTMSVKKVIGPNYTLKYSNDSFCLKRKGVEGLCEGLVVYPHDILKFLEGDIETRNCYRVTKNGETIGGIYCSKIKDILKYLS